MSKKHRRVEKSYVEELETPDIVEEIIEPIEEIKPVYGYISNCAKLNIRVAPDKTANILCEAKAYTEVMIDQSRSTDEWYSVYLSGGIEGFCMKQFIVIE